MVNRFPRRARLQLPFHPAISVREIRGADGNDKTANLNLTVGVADKGVPGARADPAQAQDAEL